MLAFGHHVEVIVRGVVLRRAVSTIAIATELAYGFQTSCALIDHLYEVVVAIGRDGDAHLYTVAHLKARRFLAVGRQQLAHHGETIAMVGNVLRGLRELGIDGTPRGILAGLVDGEGLRLGRNAGLHVTDGCGGLRRLERLAIHLELGVVVLHRERTLLVHEKGVDGVHAVDGRIPSLRALLLKQPALHLANGLLVVGRDALNGLDGYRLGGNLIVEPRVAGTWGVVVTTRLLAIDGIFLQRLHVLSSTLGFWFREDHSRKGFLVEVLRLDILLQELQQVVVGLLHISGQLSTIEGGQIEPLECFETRERYLVAILGPLLQLLDLFNDLLSHELEGLGEHRFDGLLLTCHVVEAHQHLRDGYRHIERAWHLGPPRPRAVVTL